MFGQILAKRRWKKATDEAVSAQRLACERDNLSAELARLVWLANGGHPSSDPRWEGALLDLATLIAPLLEDGVLRSAAALRHLRNLDDAVLRADYEDLPGLRAERLWTAKYLRPALQAAPHEPHEEASLGAGGSGQAALERFHGRLAARLAERIKASDLAA